MLAAIIFMLFLSAPALAEEYGSITGIVTSADNAAVPDAPVTLWAVVDGVMLEAAVPNNPQLTSNFSTSLPGAYAFTNVPPGRYNVTAVWGEYSYYAEVNLTGGTATANIVIPEHIGVPGIFAPAPTPKTYYTFVPVRISSPLPQATVARSPGFGALAILMAVPLATLARRWLRG